MAYQFTQTGQEIQYLLDEAMQLAEEYDSSVSYAVGDYCSHEGTLYRCTTATTGTWDASKWTDNVIVLNALRALKGRMDTAEGEIDAAQEDISALNQSFAQSYTVKTATNAYGTMVNRYVVIGKLVIGQVDVTPSQAISSSVGEFDNITDAPPAIMTTCTVHFINNTEQKTQYVVMRPNRSWSAYGAYTANQTVSGVYCYMTS